MKINVLPQEVRKIRLAPVATLASTAALLLLALPASAARIPARNGQIHACFKGKGKAKGSIRVVAGKRCRRGERRLTWSVTGPAGPNGAAGAQGATGPQGSPGSNGEAGRDGTSSSGGTGSGALETRVAGLGLKLESLEGVIDGLQGELDGVEEVLGGVEKGDLSGVLDKLTGVSKTDLSEAVGVAPVVSALSPKVATLEGLLEGVESGDLETALSELPALKTTVNGLGTTVSGLDTTVNGLDSSVSDLSSTLSGVTNAQLLQTVDSLPVVESLCTEASKVPGQINAVNSSLGELVEGLLGSVVGVVLGGVEAAEPVDPYSCPS